MSREPSTHVILTEGRPEAERRTFALRWSGGGQRFDTPAITIGSAAGNDVVVADPRVSRIHAEISVGDDGYRLRDLDSTNGTFVDGYRIHDAYLRPGATIQLASTEIVFEPLDDSVAVPTHAEAQFGRLIGGATKMRHLFSVLQRAAESQATMLVLGESGTGKELVAEAIHAKSPRHGGPFVVFDCAAVSANLLEAELFGHERGAFTGAVQSRPGCFEQADGGTLFLDEVGEIPLDLQAKLLRALERKEVRRVGGNERRRVDVRIVAATHRDLARKVNQGSFREDLYYRLAVVRIEVPPLRGRLDDLPLLIRHLLRGLYGGDLARAEASLANLGEATWARLHAHRWPGNVRELRNALERSVALSGFDLLDDIQLDDAPRPGSFPSSSEGLAPAVSLDEMEGRSFVELRAEAIATWEAAFVARALERHGGNITQAAQASRMDRSYFRRLMKKHGLR